MLNIDAFMVAKLAAGLSPKTVEWYRWLLVHYREYCDGHELDAHTPSAIDSFLANLRRHDSAPATVSAYYRTLRVYFGWLKKRGFCDIDPLAVVDRPRVPRQKRAHVTLAQFQRLYDSISGDQWLDYRDRAILVVMFFSGLRVGEVVDLHAADVDLLKRLITVRHGKGGHMRLVPCAPMLLDPLHAYLRLHPAWKRAQKAPALWLSSDGYIGVRGVLTAEGIRVMLRRRCEAAGMPYINPHAFRHGFAMTLLNAGMELSAVSAAMGHSSQAITEQVYAAWLTDGLAREYNEALKRILPGM
jgi:site-specific recombinase XerD